ncbi:DUF5677 domain-containing protein [Mesorhizobium sp.]|uniref:DUF5677 domain-containing protein n=1 Tax=Mesorhizobium sp. TaxID=1871066 RepID=UPI000FE54C89|nr:DUF5677 domain-containing protein [Mesorhizobium sp.]RWD09562.1 MAG: hypothetical protein EOS74_31230 [Mesorhizobium sp.]RWF66287.1 MAG: hypothetical protein EOS47_06790 [Mesorhizobium sp.]
METDAGLDGFLSESHAYEAEISRANRDAFDIARRINRECHSLLFNKAEVHNRDGQAMLVAALFLRALQHYQASILLLSKGLVASGRVAIRAELEAVFAIRAVADSEQNYRAFVNDHLHERLELIKKARQHPEYPMMQRLLDAVSDEDFARLKEQVKRAGAVNKLTTKVLSERAGLHPLYVSVYRLLSAAVHSGARELDAYLMLDADGEVREIDYATGLHEVSDLLLTAGDFILLGSDAVCRQFEITSFAEPRRELSAAIVAGMENSPED